MGGEYIFQRLCQIIAIKQESFPLSDEIEADESYFGGVRKRRRGSGAAETVPVLGLLTRGKKAYVQSYQMPKPRPLGDVIGSYLCKPFLNPRIHQYLIIFVNQPDREQEQ